MIRQLGAHRGKQVVFGHDRYLVPELDGYMRALSKYGVVFRAINFEEPHYLTSAERVCERMKDRPDMVGVLICSTGMGMSIAANKFRGIYAARCLTIDDAQMSRTINNANVLCLATRTGLEVNESILDAFMTTPYEGRKLDQLEYIASMEIERDREPAPKPYPAIIVGRARA
jgi:RpiB/LacA/LacB family sugar-phosphate isomerase